VSGSGSILNRPPWLALTALSAILTGLACYPSWPGYMSYDSLLAYEQALFGVRTALWPPLHTYMFQVSRMLGAESWGLFLTQTFVLLFGAGLTIHVLTARRALAWVLCLFFAGGLVFFPVVRRRSDDPCADRTPGAGLGALPVLRRRAGLCAGAAGHADGAVA
jgi:hypothetical protein